MKKVFTLRIEGEDEYRPGWTADGTLRAKTAQAAKIRASRFAREYYCPPFTLVLSDGDGFYARRVFLADGRAKNWERYQY